MVLIVVMLVLVGTSFRGFAEDFVVEVLVTGALLRPESLQVTQDSFGDIHIVVSDMRMVDGWIYPVWYATSADDWIVHDIDDDAGSYSRVNIAVCADATGMPHIFYYDTIAGALRRVTPSAGIGSTWDVEDVTTDARNDGLAAAMDANGYFHCVYEAPDSYYQSKIMHAYTDETGAWTEEVVRNRDSLDSYRGPPAIVVDGANRPHVAWSSNRSTSPDYCGVFYGIRDGGGWTVERVHDNPAYSLDLALDENGDPHVMYALEGDTCTRTIIHAWKEASSWSTEVAAECGNDPSIQFDSSGNARMAYRDSESLHYATCSAGSWVHEAIAAPDVMGGPELVLVDGDSPRIYYSNVNTRSLYDVHIDSSAPSPDPMTWESVPAGAGEVSVSMQATTATDPSGVEYFFEETTGRSGGDDSGWQAETTYADAGLVDGTEYGYRVKARDGLGYETGWSALECVTAVDDVPPDWDEGFVAPGVFESSPGELSMEAEPATDPSGVEYFFEETSGNPGGNSSGWQTSSTYTDDGLSEKTEYCYRVKVRDLSAALNESAWSSQDCATTSEWSAPVPNPMDYTLAPSRLGEGTIRMIATTATDPSGVEYYFEETTGRTGGSESGWQTSPEFLDYGLLPSTQYCYRVKARDLSANFNETGWSALRCGSTRAVPDPVDPPSIAWKGFSRCEDPAYPQPWPEVRDLAVDPFGNVIIVGETGWDDGGSDEWEGVAIVTKWSSGGAPLWHRVLELPDAYCHPRSVACGTDGSIYVAGLWSPVNTIAWPGWFVTRISPDGVEVSTYSHDWSWIGLYSVDVDDDGYAYVCGNCWNDEVFVGRFDFTAGAFDWSTCYSLTPTTANIGHGVCGTLTSDAYCFAKNITDGATQKTAFVLVSRATGDILDFAFHDLAPGLEEAVTELDVDAYGSIVGSVWAIASQTGYITKLSAELDVQWTVGFESEPGRYLVMRGITAGPDWTIYAVGRDGTEADWDRNGGDAHAVAFCVTGDGNYLWGDAFDPGGAEEEESGLGDGVACSPDGTQTYAGASVSYSETSWERSLCVLAYGDEPVFDDPTAASFRVAAITGDVRADGTIHTASIGTGSADVAEWVCVTDAVEPGDVLEHNPDVPGCYRLSTESVSTLVAGVVSTEPGLVLGAGSTDGGQALLALTGIVPTKVTSEGGPIQPGDLLVASSTPGHAMRWARPDPRPCALVGKALEPMTGNSGVILVLLTAH